MVIATAGTTKELKILPESIFYDGVSPHIDSFYRKSRGNVSRSIIDLSIDSYIIAHCGHRGAGKNLWMSFLLLKGAWLYKKRLLTNYPLGVIIRDRFGRLNTVEAEPLDVARMLEFDNEYDNCIIGIQEAPTIINRMAAATWKNRLLNLWLQEIRHSHSSLLYESQNEFWVDGELQWQTDVVNYVTDASRRYPTAGLQRGGVVMGRLKDKSGMWTGYPYDERPVFHQMRLNALPIFNTYDTYYKGDIWESLRKVDLKLSKYHIDHTEKPEVDYKDVALQVIDSFMQGETTIPRRDFYKILPLESESDKHRLANDLARAGVTKGKWDSESDTYMLDFTNFDRKKFQNS